MTRYTSRPVRLYSQPARHAVYDVDTGEAVTEPLPPDEARATAKRLNRQARAAANAAKREANAEAVAERRITRRVERLAADLALVREHGSVQAAADAVQRSKQSFYQRPGFKEALALMRP